MTTAAAAAVASGSTGRSPASTATTTSTTTTSATTTTSVAGARARAGAHAHELAFWNRHIRRSRAGARRWWTIVLGRPPGHVPRVLSAHSVLRLRQLAKTWRRREHAAWWHANHPPNLQGWLCIHHYEGSWTDSGGPYWGGLQMDLGFQTTYGNWLLRHKGTADHWSPLEQVWAAVRASHVRGFSPWPNTARYCGMA